MAPFILRFFALLMLGLPGVCALMAQEKGGLPMAVEIQETYEKGYRNLDGTPGEKYWTNTADYTFDVNLDLEADVLEGKGKITYTNNSPRRLSQVVIRLGQDLYKKGGIRDFQARLSQLHDGVRINRVAVRGEEVDLSGAPAQRAARRPRFRQSGTNIFLRLGKSLPSGESVDIEIDWAYDLPDGGVQRQGKYAENAYFIAYWYPEIAVYDELDGWDSRNYSGTVEMYHDFSNYEVNLTVPDQVFVWATGLLQNPDEILTNEYLQRFQQAGRTDEVVRIVTTEDLNKGGILKKNGRNTWRFKAREVPDFAFAVADSFLWDGTSVEVAPGRRVLVDVGYRQGARWYDEAAEIARLSVKDMSEKLPGVPYPYPQVSVFNGAGGMEFPMIVNDGRVRGRQDLIDLTYHEIVHTYFPFYMGINERKYAWMDEGWAQLLPNDLIRELEPEGGDPMIGNSFSVASYAGREEDLPLMTPTYMLRGQAYESILIPSLPVPTISCEKNWGMSCLLNACRPISSAGIISIPYPMIFSLPSMR
ncbi:MAG: M1 family metallopeptidase [Bacteroidota bacterium]